MNDKLIQIGGKSYKECEIIMLATEKAQLNALCLTASSKLILLDGKDWETVNNVAGFRPQHLYILSSEEIKEGEYYYDVRRNNIGKRESHSGSLNNYNYYKKIIATTDESLEIACKVECHDCNGKGEQIMPYKDNGEVCSRCSGTGLEDNEKPFLRPSDDFLKAFVKAQGKIDKVLVEYVDWCDYDNKIGLDKPDLRLKVTPDNTITIKPIQEEKVSWNKEEIIQLIVNTIYYGVDTNGNLSDKWIEQNL